MKAIPLRRDSSKGTGRVEGREGPANWTLAELGKERVWSEFIQNDSTLHGTTEADRSLLTSSPQTASSHARCQQRQA
jgi:hypothetical protein